MSKMKKVVVVLSSYNGERYIIRQLDSLINQEGIELCCYIRDDGSTDGTVPLIREYQKLHPNVIKLSAESNMGWRRSFFKALRDAPEADYYAFCDQDDVWLPRKLLTGVETLEQHSQERPLLFHCARRNVNNDMELISDKCQMLPRPLNKKNALVQEYCQGCAMLFNNAAKELMLRYTPNEKMTHDFWGGMLCYLFGEVYYSEIPLFNYVHHQDNASVSGDAAKSRQKRLKNFFSYGNYHNPSQDLLNGYADLLSKEEIRYLKCLKDARTSMACRLKLFCDKEFIRSTFIGTVSLKLTILLGRY